MLEPALCQSIALTSFVIASASFGDSAAITWDIARSTPTSRCLGSCRFSRPSRPCWGRDARDSFRSRIAGSTPPRRASRLAGRAWRFAGSRICSLARGSDRRRCWWGLLAPRLMLRPWRPPPRAAKTCAVASCTPPLLIDPAANDRLIEPLAIHLLRLDRLGHRVHEFIRLPEARLLLGKLEALLDYFLAVGVLEVHHIVADVVGVVGAVGEQRPVKTDDRNIEIALHELSRLVVDYGISLLGTLRLDEGDGLLHHGDRLLLGGRRGIRRLRLDPNATSGGYECGSSKKTQKLSQGVSSRFVSSDRCRRRLPSRRAVRNTSASARPAWSPGS